MSDMDTLAADIRAVLALLDVDDENTIRMPAIVAFHNNAEGWLRALLDDRKHLQALVEALAKIADIVERDESFEDNRIAKIARDALASYERTVGE